MSGNALPGEGAEPIALPLPPRSAVRAFEDPPVKTLRVLGALVLHAALGVLLGKVGSVSPVHALGTAALAFWVAWTDRTLVRTACLVAYIAGSEALWRITGANVVWELGKYSIVGAMLIALVRHGRFRPYPPPLIYFAALVPSALLTFASADFDRARQIVSFDMSGPVSLAVGVLFFVRVRLTGRQLARVLLHYVVPTVAVVVLIVMGLAGSEIQFGNSSIAAASGGFGPNQVSASLGLGSLACFLVITTRPVPLALKGLMGCCLLMFAAQSALTFSRCGLYYFAGGTLLATVLLLRNPQMILQLGVGGLVLAAAGYFVIYPWLDDFTGGALSNRFKNTDLTNRDKIMAMDLQIFAENPVLGIGVGRGKEVREAMEYRAASHTEYTRLLAEHGSLGVLAIGMILWMALSHFLRARTVHGRAVTAALVAYTLLYMTGNGMRQVLPGFTFGLAAAMFLPGLGLRPAANVTPLVEAAPAAPGE